MDGGESEVRSVHRREARSGKVSYGDPVILHETSKRRIVMVPFFIPRSEGTDLSIKVVTYLKDPSLGVIPVEEKSLSLNEAGSRQLLQALRDHLAVAKEGADDGNYLLIPVTGGTAHLSGHDPVSIARALTRALAQEEVVQHLSNADLGEELASAFRGAIRLNEMRSAVAELRGALDGGESDEDYYQSWCERHTWAFGNAYVMRDEVREISPGDNLDMMLPTVITGYRDIVELKRPDMAVLQYDSNHRNYYFGADVSRAIGQCHRYLDVLHDVAAKGLRDHPEVVAYHPRAVIVIGRSSDWDDDRLRALHGFNCRLSGITVMTYDQLLAQGERLLQMLSSGQGGSSEEDPLEVLEKEDIPF